MTQKLADNLIQWYKETIEIVKTQESPGEWITTLQNRCTDNGICSCASKIFDEYIYSDLWVLFEAMPGRAYWFDPPSANYYDKKAVLLSLYNRINILETFKE